MMQLVEMTTVVKEFLKSDHDWQSYNNLKIANLHIYDDNNDVIHVLINMHMLFI